MPKARKSMPLREYRAKRELRRSGEPRGTSRRQLKRPRAGRAKRPVFVIQQHAARRLHWDFRLECDGVLKSWAITSEPTTSIGERHLAIETEDHPLEYGSFHGVIPPGHYGAGTVDIWDHGTFELGEFGKSASSLARAIERGHIHVKLRGRKLRGSFALVRFGGDVPGPRAKWLFFKTRPKAIGPRVPSIA